MATVPLTVYLDNSAVDTYFVSYNRNPVVRIVSNVGRRAKGPSKSPSGEKPERTYYCHVEFGSHFGSIIEQKEDMKEASVDGKLDKI